MAPRKTTTDDGYVIPSAKRLSEKLALKGKPFTCKTLARSVEAGTITQAQAEKHRPDFADYCKRRTDAGLAITASGKELAEAKPSAPAEKKPRKRQAAAKKSTRTKATAKVTPDVKAALKSLTPAEVKALLSAL